MDGILGSLSARELLPGPQKPLKRSCRFAHRHGHHLIYISALIGGVYTASYSVRPLLWQVPNDLVLPMLRHLLTSRRARQTMNPS